jgi:hypothetical protein
MTDQVVVLFSHVSDLVMISLVAVVPAGSTAAPPHHCTATFQSLIPEVWILSQVSILISSKIEV